MSAVTAPPPPPLPRLPRAALRTHRAAVAAIAAALLGAGLVGVAAWMVALAPEEIVLVTYRTEPAPPSPDDPQVEYAEAFGDEMIWQGGPAPEAIALTAGGGALLLGLAGGFGLGHRAARRTPSAPTPETTA